MASSFEIKSTRPSVGETIVTIVRDHIDYRKQIFKLAGSDLRRTYRASALGWSWAIIKPLVTIFVYWFAFAVGLRRGGDIEGYPFVLWLISGIVPWFYMSEMLTLGTECILRNRYLVTKMKYPDQNGISTNIHNIGDHGNHHRPPGVLLGTENRCRGIIRRNKRE